MNETLHLDICIFYARNSWHRLLNQLTPVLTNWNEISDYSLRLSTNRGNHIALTLETNKKDAKSLAAKADLFINHFLKAHPSTSEEMALPLNEMFLNFKNNSVHYGILEKKLIQNKLAMAEKMDHKIATILLQVFEEYQEDTPDYLVEVMIELFVIFYRAICLKKDDTLKVFDHLLNSEYKKYKPEALDRIGAVNKVNYENNKDSILELLRMYEQETFPVEGRHWQNNWYNAVQSFSESSLLDVTSEQAIDKSVFLIFQLCDTFDFKDRTIAFYLFSKSLEKYID